MTLKLFKRQQEGTNTAQRRIENYSGVSESYFAAVLVSTNGFFRIGVHERRHWRSAANANAIAGPPPLQVRKNDARAANSGAISRKRIQGELSSRLFCGVGVLYSSADASSPVADR